MPDTERGSPGKETHEDDVCWFWVPLFPTLKLWLVPDPFWRAPVPCDDSLPSAEADALLWFGEAEEPGEGEDRDDEGDEGVEWVREEVAQEAAVAWDHAGVCAVVGRRGRGRERWPSARRARGEHPGARLYGKGGSTAGCIPSRKRKRTRRGEDQEPEKCPSAVDLDPPTRLSNR